MILFDDRSARTRVLTLFFGVLIAGTPAAWAQSDTPAKGSEAPAADTTSEGTPATDTQVRHARINAALLAAQRLERERRWREAADKYNEVLAMMPDNTVAGFRHRQKPIFAVQFHPEASPGPHDSTHLFEQFVAQMRQARMAAS